ncbi:DUF1289 domain-containing protein [Trinickia sp. LjRoot230]|uniref:DUF1289 domain-containing protein n=1 Tax=Trinickia sp. LjRoot230 TaxID=3342288 RepID=UPI003ECD6927
MTQNDERLSDAAVVRKLDRAIACAQALRPVGSPCIDICRLDRDRQRCTGCRRTIDEIRAWKSLDDTDKLRILNTLSARC